MASDDVSTQDEHAQPMPVPNDRPSIQSLVQADLEQRERIGVQRYGTTLQAHNGRDALRDLYEELLDGACYARQVMEERDTPTVDGDVRISEPGPSRRLSFSEIADLIEAQPENWQG